MHNSEKFIPFSIEEAAKRGNIWKQENYTKVIFTKAYRLYSTYERKGTRLIGIGENLGLLTFFSGMAYRGMGALGCSFDRTRGVGILNNSNNYMFKVLSGKGLEEKTKELRFRNLTANKYMLVINKERLSIGLLGDDYSFVDLTSDWSSCMTFDFTENSY